MNENENIRAHSNIRKATKGEANIKIYWVSKQLEYSQTTKRVKLKGKWKSIICLPMWNGETSFLTNFKANKSIEVATPSIRYS